MLGGWREEKGTRLPLYEKADIRRRAGTCPHNYSSSPISLGHAWLHKEMGWGLFYNPLWRTG